ncbi:lipocalin family protein [Paraburkholderia sp. SIMBA_027]|uniref:lipocalin family protein n=1 Tax=Paraburkholderia sp. SIMBA_027 TaxID=3085770 RepID=UPI00397B19AC
MQKKILGAALTGAAFILGACAYIPRPGHVGNPAVPPPAKPVDLSKYMGRWYEQFRYEASFEKDIDEVTAEYSLNEDGTVKVVNRGRVEDDPSAFRQSVGKAKVVDRATNAKLKVSFFGPFYGDYWILDHGDDYEWSIVGEPSGRYLWVLTRAAHPSPDMLDRLQARVRALGYDWALVRVTRH